MEEPEIKKPAAEQRAMQLQKTKLLGHIVSSQEANLFARKARNISRCWMRISRSNGEELVPVHKRLSLSLANHLKKNKDGAIGYKSRADVYLPNEQMKEVLKRAFCSMEDVLDDNRRQAEHLTGMDKDGNKLVDDVARVDQLSLIHI